MRIFLDRQDAGRRLAERLATYAGRSDVCVLALPRGGVEVGAEVARGLGAPLDVLVVRKLGMPWQPELAMGAVAGGGVRVLNEQVVSELGIPAAVIEGVAEEERREVVRRERAYRGSAPALDVRDWTVILVDDGIATGSTARAAVRALRAMGPARIVLATPVAPPDACARLEREVDALVCLASPRPFYAIGVWYERFPQLDDATVRRLLADAAPTEAGIGA